MLVPCDALPTMSHAAPADVIPIFTAFLCSTSVLQRVKKHSSDGNSKKRYCLLAERQLTQINANSSSRHRVRIIGGSQETANKGSSPRARGGRGVGLGQPSSLAGQVAITRTQGRVAPAARAARPTTNLMAAAAAAAARWLRPPRTALQTPRPAPAPGGTSCWGWA